VKDTADPVSVLAPRPTYIRHFVLAALCVITTISYMQRNSLAAVETLVNADLGVGSDDMGYAKGGFFLAYALCQIPSGWLAQRWGGRRTLSLYAAGWSLFMGWTALANSLSILVVLRAAMGTLQAGIFPCCTMILASWYPIARRGFASAVLNSFMLIGGAVAAALTALLIGPLGWRGLFALYALPGLAWAVWFAWWFRNRPSEHVAVNAGERSLLAAPPTSDAPAATPIPWLKIFLSYPLWLICLQQCCRAGAVRFFDQSLPTYLQQARGQSIEEANLWTSLPLWAGVIGGMLGGILSDGVLRRTGSRRAARQGVAIVSLLLAVLVYCVAYRIGDVRWAVLTAGVGACIMTFSSPCAYALTMDMGGRNLGIIFATMNMAGNLGATAFTTFIPTVVKWWGWDAALFVFAAMHVVALLCWLLLNPNGVIGEAAPAAPHSKE
jgi:ACS family glucarate transporter-like MFS transporter